MSFGYSIGDFLVLAQYSWKVYESFHHDRANIEYERFKKEFRQVVECLEKLKNINGNLSDPDAIPEATFRECEVFIKKHRHLTGQLKADSNGSAEVNKQRTGFSAQLLKVFQTATWPLYREEAQKLHEQLDRIISVANLRATSATLEKTKNIEMHSEEVTQAVKSLTAKVNLLLKRIAPSPGEGAFGLDQRYTEQFAPIPHMHLGSLDGLVPSSNKALLQLVREASQRIEYLIMRDLTRPSSEQNGNASTRSLGLVEHVQSIIQFLDSARAIANAALHDTNLPLSPSQLQIQAPPPSSNDILERRGGPTETFHQVTQDWDVFSRWLNFHMLHDNRAEKARSIEFAPPTNVGSGASLSPSTADVSTLPSTSATTPNTIASNWSDSQPRRFSSIDLGSPIFSQNGSVSSYRVRLDFPDAEKRKLWHPSIEGSLEIHFGQNGRTKILRTVDQNGRFTAYHTPCHDQRTHSSNPLIPWIDNKHVTGNSLKLQFKGFHKVTVHDTHGDKNRSERLKPVYKFENAEDFQNVQRELLGRSVVSSFDVVRISSQAGEDHCTSETLRVLEDPSQQKHLLYFAHRLPPKSPTTSSGFVEWPMDDFEGIRKLNKNEVRLLFRVNNNLPRRSTTGSIASIASFSSRSSQSTEEDKTSLLRRRIKALDVEFYDEKDRKAFEETWKSAAAPPVFHTISFTPSSLGVGQLASTS